jgi:DNA-binding IclR family transcriptional regulator
MNPPNNQFKGRKVVKVSAITYAQLIKHLDHGDMTCEELAEATGLHKLTVYHYCKALHEAGAIHIARFEPDVNGRHTIKVYKLGEAKDAKRVRMTQVDRQARHRAKIAAQQLALVMAGKGEYIPRANGRKLFQMLEAA